MLTTLNYGEKSWIKKETLIKCLEITSRLNTTQTHMLQDLVREDCIKFQKIKRSFQMQ